MSDDVNLSQEELIAVLRNLSMKADFANAQLLNLGLIVEYYGEVIQEAGIDLKLDAFEDWAKARHEEIKSFANTSLAKDVAEQLKDELGKLSGIDLTE